MQGFPGLANSPTAPTGGSSGGRGAAPRRHRTGHRMLRKQEQRLALFRQEQGLSRDLLALDQQRQDELNEINNLVGVSADLIEQLTFNANNIGASEQLEAIEEFGKMQFKLLMN